MVDAIWPAGRRANEAALHLAWSAISAGVGPFGTGIGGAARAAAMEAAISEQTSRRRERISDPESVMLHAGYHRTPRRQSGDQALRLLLLVAVLRHVAARAVVLVGQELARHGDLDAVAARVGLALHHHVEVDRRHDAVAELLLDQRLPGRAVDHDELVEAVDQRVGRRHRRAAHRHLVEHRGLGLGEGEQVGGLGGLRLGELHLAEQRADDQHRRHAADLAADVAPLPALLALDVEDLLGELVAGHEAVLSRLVRDGKEDGACAPSPRSGEGGGGALSELELKLRAPLTRLASLATLSPSGRGKTSAAGRTTGTWRLSKPVSLISSAKLLLRAMRKSMMWLRVA